MLDCSFGTIPFRVEAGIVRFLLVWETYGDGHWNFPKGHAKDSETPLETALRELKEETGLIPNQIISEQTLIQEYSFKHKDRIVHRRLEYFLALIDKAEVRLQLEEVSKFQWMTLTELLATTPFPELQEMARQAHAMIITHQRGKA